MEVSVSVGASVSVPNTSFPSLMETDTPGISPANARDTMRMNTSRTTRTAMSGNCFLVLLFFDFAMCFGSPVPGGRALLILHLLYHTDTEFSSLAHGRTKFSADGKSAPETGGKTRNAARGLSESTKRVLRDVTDCAFTLLTFGGKHGKIKTKETGNSLSRILNKNTFILGLDDSFPPMGYRDENNEIVGFDIDVAKEVCKRLGVQLVIQPISWNAKEQELNSYNIDCIWNGMSINEKRKEAMSLSDSYMTNRMIFVVKNESNIQKLEDLTGKNIGVQSGSSAEETLEASNVYSQAKQVISYADNITAFMDMETNQTEAVFVDEVLANYYIASNNKNYRILDEALEEEQYAIGFRKQDTELCNKINEILKEMKTDGTLAKISTKWFGKDVTTIK